MLNRLFPKTDNRFEGHRAALWLLGLYVALKFAMSFNSIFFAARVAASADGIPLDSFAPAAAREVLTLFALTGLGQLALALVSLTILVRYRALVAFIYLTLLAEAVARRLVIQGYEPSRTAGGSVGFWINIGLLGWLALGLLLSLTRGDRNELQR